MIDTIFRTAFVWIGLLVVFRLSGRRTLGELSAVDFIALLISGELVQQALLRDDQSVTGTFLVVVTLMLLSVGFSLLKQRVPGVGRLLEGVPTLLVRDGVPEVERMRRARVDLDDLLAAARQSGVAELGGVRYAVLETDGRISIVPMEPGPAAAAAGRGGVYAPR